MHQVTNLGRRRLDIELRRTDGVRRFSAIEAGATQPLDIDPADPTTVGRVAVGILAISAVDQPAFAKAPMPRRLGVRLARKPTAHPIEATSGKDDPDA